MAHLVTPRVIIYNNPSAPSGHPIVDPTCAEHLTQALLHYGVPASEIVVCDTAQKVGHLLQKLSPQSPIPTLFIPGGFAVDLCEDFRRASVLVDAGNQWGPTAQAVNLLIKELFESGRLNLFGSCSGMLWMVEGLGFAGFLFPRCNTIGSFQTISSGHGTSTLYPKVIASNSSFYTTWNSGLCVQIQNTEIASIAKYAAMSQKDSPDFPPLLKMQLINRRQFNDPSTLPHAAIERLHASGSMAIGLGFHPEQPIPQDQLPQGINPEENRALNERFLFEQFDKLHLPRAVTHVAQAAEKVLAAS